MQLAHPQDRWPDLTAQALPFLTGAATAAILLVELRPLLRAIVWLAGA